MRVPRSTSAKRRPWRSWANCCASGIVGLSYFDVQILHLQVLYVKPADLQARRTVCGGKMVTRTHPHRGKGKQRVLREVRRRWLQPKAPADLKGGHRDREPPPATVVVPVPVRR